MSTRRRGTHVLVAGLLATGLACGHHRPPSEEPVNSRSAAIAVHLNVVNNNPLAMVVYAVGSSINYRMGSVDPGMSSHFVFPQGMIGNGPLELQARPSGGGDLIRTGQLVLSPGQIVEWRIGTQQVNSTVTVRP